MTESHGLSSFTSKDGRPGLDPKFRRLKGPRLIAEAFLKRIISPRESVHYDLDLGKDVRAFLSSRLDAGRLFSIGIALSAEGAKDERVESADVDVTIVERAGKKTLRVAGKLTPVEGETFDFVGEINEVRAALLEPRL